MFQTGFAAIGTFVGNKSDRFGFCFSLEHLHDFVKFHLIFLSVDVVIRETTCLSTTNGVLTLQNEKT